MNKLSVAGMAAVEQIKKERAELLKVLISKPFNLHDEEQQMALKRYIDHFEFTVHQMYLFQGMSTGLTAWGGSWLLGFFLPIPAFANYILSIFLYCGAAGYILEHFSMQEFHAQLDEMKTIYNWCLKKNQIEYDGTDNTTILSNPLVQKMIKLIAPLSPTEFMLAWKKVTQEEEPKSTIWGSVSFAYSLFSSSKSSVNHHRLLDLKASVENRELDIGVFKGVEEAIRYFATDPNFRALLVDKVKQPIDQIKNILPSVLSLGYSKSE